MPTDVEYKSRISSYNWDDLMKLWLEIMSGNTPEWDAGKALEYLVLRAFQLDGADVIWPYTVVLEEEETEQIEQIDGVVYIDSLACLVECKDTGNKVNVEPIAKLRNQLLRRPGATIGSIFSRTGFTKPAMILSRFIAPQTILLWSGKEIGYSLQHKCISRAILKKYRHCIENAIPDYDITSERILL